LINDSAEDSAYPIPVDLFNLPDPHPSLGADEVHAWHADLDNHSPDSLRLLLAEDEVARADRFHFARDRNHYTVARGLLRKLIGGYLGIAAADVRFTYAEKGKPSLAGSRSSLLSFNLAHSHGKAIYAFSRGRDLGVDVEFIREDLADEEISERFFSRSEVRALQTVPAELRKQAFFNCWTRKEAYIKARGDGLSMPLDGFDVSLLPGEPAVLLKNHEDGTEVARWKMRSITVAPGYVAALVVEGHDWQLKTFRLKQ